MCRYYSEICKPEEATELLNLAQGICWSANDSQDISEYQLRIFRGRIHVAYVSHDRDEYDDFAQKSFTAERRRHEKTQQRSQRLAAATLHMGIARIFFARYEEALALIEISANIRESLPGFKRDWLYSTQIQAAHAYLHLGQIQKAEDTLRTALKDRVAALGEDDSYSIR